MPKNADPLLQTALERLAVPGILIGHRFVAPGDECALMSQETVATWPKEARRRSGAARSVARELLGRAGYRAAAVPKAPTGAPSWPPGIVGSLAHDSQVAVAAIAPECDFAAIGIDVEPAEVPPRELVTTIATPSEQDSLHAYLYGGRLLFAAKEAVYKAVADLDEIFLEHHDVEINFAKHSASVPNGRTVELRFCVCNRLLALAFIRRAPTIK
jgi:4'-phosphopantetheinyl transferase EntD